MGRRVSQTHQQAAYYSVSEINCVQTDLSWVEGVGTVNQSEEELPSEVAFLIWGLTLGTSGIYCNR